MTLLGWFRGDRETTEKPAKEPEAMNQFIPPVNPHAILDPRSQTWIFVSTWAQERLEKARVRNDNPNTDMTQTAVLRGEIKLLKELINLPIPKRGLLVDEE